MIDICKCQGEGCPLKEKCFRYIAKPGEYLQSYFMTPPYKDGKCDHFWDNDERNARIKSKLKDAKCAEETKT